MFWNLYILPSLTGYFTGAGRFCEAILKNMSKHDTWIHYVLHSQLNTAQLRNSVHILTPWCRDKVFAIFQFIFMNENIWIPTKILLKFVPKGPINNISALVLGPGMRQAIIWTNNGPVYRHMCASLSINVLRDMPYMWMYGMQKKRKKTQY